MLISNTATSASPITGWAQLFRNAQNLALYMARPWGYFLLGVADINYPWKSARLVVWMWMPHKMPFWVTFIIFACHYINDSQYHSLSIPLMFIFHRTWKTLHLKPASLKIHRIVSHIIMVPFNPSSHCKNTVDVSSYLSVNIFMSHETASYIKTPIRNLHAPSSNTGSATSSCHPRIPLLALQIRTSGIFLSLL